jgi:hypothetical protein
MKRGALLKLAGTAATWLGLDVSPALLARADDVIE